MLTRYFQRSFVISKLFEIFPRCYLFLKGGIGDLTSAYPREKASISGQHQKEASIRGPHQKEALIRGQHQKEASIRRSSNSRSRYQIGLALQSF